MHVGQFLDYSYTVTNTGAGATPPGQTFWDDRIYLSADPFLDLNADRYIDTFRRSRRPRRRRELRRRAQRRA